MNLWLGIERRCNSLKPLISEFKKHQFTQLMIYDWSAQTLTSTDRDRHDNMQTSERPRANHACPSG
jgi:hypothetical protein